MSVQSCFFFFKWHWIEKKIFCKSAWLLSTKTLIYMAPNSLRLMLFALHILPECNVSLQDAYRLLHVVSLIHLQHSVSVVMEEC